MIWLLYQLLRANRILAISNDRLSYLFLLSALLWNGFGSEGGLMHASNRISCLNKRQCLCQRFNKATFGVEKFMQVSDAVGATMLWMWTRRTTVFYYALLDLRWISHQSRNHVSLNNYRLSRFCSETFKYICYRCRAMNRAWALVDNVHSPLLTRMEI